MKTKHFLFKIRRFSIFLLTLLGWLLFQNRSFAQNAGDSITHINCPGADTILAGMVVSDNGIIQYTTNRETGIYNTVTGKKLGSTGGHAKLFKDSHNNIWQAHGNSISKLNEKGNTLDQFAIPSGYQSGGFRINDATVDKKGNLWVATNTGLLVKTSSGWIQYKAANSSLWSNNVYEIKIDSNNNKWILTDSGMDILGDTICSNCSQWKTLFSRKKGQWAPNVNAIVFDKNCIAIFGTPNGGLLRVKNGMVDTLPVSKNRALKNIMFSCLATDSSGNIWAGTWGKGLIRVNTQGSGYRIYNVMNSSIGSNYINALYAGKHGIIYAGTAGKGIYKIKAAMDSSIGFPENAASSVSQTQNLISNHINVFPNPSNGIFNLKPDQPGIYDLDISDVSGKRIKTIRELYVGQNAILDLSDLNAGIYFLDFHSKTSESTIKITIQK